MIYNLDKTQSLINQYLVEMRDAQIQKDALRYRMNTERIGMLIGYEISKTLEFENKEVQTPLGISDSKVIKDKIVSATILRAGLPLNNGLLHVFDKAESGFVTAYRKYRNDNNFEIKVEYMSAPSIQDKILILSDPMLATGSSMIMSYKALLQKGKPKHTHIVSVLASKEGIEYVKRKTETKS